MRVADVRQRGGLHPWPNVTVNRMCDRVCTQAKLCGNRHGTSNCCAGDVGAECHLILHMRFIEPAFYDDSVHSDTGEFSTPSRGRESNFFALRLGLAFRELCAFLLIHTYTPSAGPTIRDCPTPKLPICSPLTDRHPSQSQMDPAYAIVKPVEHQTLAESMAYANALLLAVADKSVQKQLSKTFTHKVLLSRSAAEWKALEAAAGEAAVVAARRALEANADEERNTQIRRGVQTCDCASCISLAHTATRLPLFAGTIITPCKLRRAWWRTW
jgi:hypothetical protein